jgi:hypothetical protein
MSGSRLFWTDSLCGICNSSGVKVAKLWLNRFVKVGYCHITQLINVL